MPAALPQPYLARHGETPWTVSGQHTGRTDIPLTERGERNARRLGERLRGLSFPHVVTSPLTTRVTSAIEGGAPSRLLSFNLQSAIERRQWRKRGRPSFPYTDVWTSGPPIVPDSLYGLVQP